MITNKRNEKADQTANNQIKRNECSVAQIMPDTCAGGYMFEDKILGVNVEITRKGFFGGLCAQMLNNRKLFMGKSGVDGWICENFERIINRSEESVCNSNFVVLKNGSMSQQSEHIALQKDKKYEAKVWIKVYSESAEITFGVEGFEQSLSVAADSEAYQVLSFVFDGQMLENGRFYVDASGEVAVYEVSLMPTEHFYGMRWDVIQQLRTIAPTSLRFPGGCAADHFFWRESLKTPEFRKPVDGLSKDFLFRDTYHQDTLDIGLNEFFMLCKELNAEPEFTVSLVNSDAEDARQLVEYCNGDEKTEYGAKRRELGFEAFNVRFWYVGNEAYFFGGKYADSIAAAKRTDELIKAMKQADPSIAVAIGLTWGKGHQKWAFDFMNNLKSDFEYVSYHDYIGKLPDAAQGENGMATCEMLESNFINGECFGLNFYRNELYADCFDDIRICVDEWNYSWGMESSNMLFFSNALQFHFLAKGKESYHIDRAEFFMPVNEGMITVQGNKCKMESTGEMFRLLAGHKGGRVIPCEADNKTLDILCTIHNDHIYISVINRGSETVELNFGNHCPLDCVEIEVKEYSPESNDYEVKNRKNPVVHGHSMSFITLSL